MLFFRFDDSSKRHNYNKKSFRVTPVGTKVLHTIADIVNYVSLNVIQANFIFHWPFLILSAAHVKQDYCNGHTYRLLFKFPMIGAQNMRKQSSHIPPLYLYVYEETAQIFSLTILCIQFSILSALKWCIGTLVPKGLKSTRWLAPLFDFIGETIMLDYIIFWNLKHWTLQSWVTAANLLLFALAFCFYCIINIYCSPLMWAATWQNQQCDNAPSEDSDQPGHPPSLIRVFAVRSMGS